MKKVQVVYPRKVQDGLSVTENVLTKQDSPDFFVNNKYIVNVKYFDEGEWIYACQIYEKQDDGSKKVIQSFWSTSKQSIIDHIWKILPIGTFDDINQEFIDAINAFSQEWNFPSPDNDNSWQFFDAFTTDPSKSWRVITEPNDELEQILQQYSQKGITLPHYKDTLDYSIEDIEILGDNRNIEDFILLNKPISFSKSLSDRNTIQYLRSKIEELWIEKSVWRLLLRFFYTNNRTIRNFVKSSLNMFVDDLLLQIKKSNIQLWLFEKIQKKKILDEYTSITSKIDINGLYDKHMTKMINDLVNYFSH